MSYLVIAVIVGLVGGFNPDFEQLKEDIGQWLAGWVIRALIAIIFWVAVVYLALPGLYGPFWGFSSMLLLTMIGNALITGLIAEEFPKGAYISAIFLVLVSCRGIASCSMIQSTNLKGMIGQVQEKSWQDDFHPIDAKHIRIIDLEHATWLGNQDLGKIPGNIGSRFHVGTFHIQRVKNELWWVAPLEFNGFASWQSYHETYGFVMVNAEDRNRPVRIEQRKLRYVESGWFGDNLHRYVYSQGHQFTGLTDFTFEVDDDLNPYWVITKFDLAYQYTGQKVTGILLVNAETGEIKEYKPDEVSAWVDRVIPQEIAFNYAQWWGTYIHGWWNSFWSEQDVMIPTESQGREDMWLVYGNDGQPYWFTGMTSSSVKDNALVGFLMISSRNGKAFYYRLSGANEFAVLQSASSGLGAEATKWHPTDPILYNIYGTLTWVIPVLSSEHVFQRIAMVEAASARVAFGTDKTEALAEYRKLLATNGNTVAPATEKFIKKAEGTINRIAADNQGGVTTYFIWLKEMPDKLFAGTSKISEELPIARDGDQIKITYLETTESIIQMQSFDISGITFTKSEIQRSSDEIRARAEQENQQQISGEEAKRRLENLNPADLQKVLQILEQQKKNPQ